LEKPRDLCPSGLGRGEKERGIEESALSRDFSFKKKLLSHTRSQEKEKQKKGHKIKRGSRSPRLKSRRSVREERKRERGEPEATVLYAGGKKKARRALELLWEAEFLLRAEEKEKEE